MADEGAPSGFDKNMAEAASAASLAATLLPPFLEIMNKVADLIVKLHGQKSGPTQP